MGDTIRFDSTVDAAASGSQSLLVRTDGTTEFDRPVGGTTPLGGLHVQGYSASNLGTTDLNGGSVTTTGVGGQTYDNAVVLGADTTFTDQAGQGITFGSTVDSQAGKNRDITLSSTAGTVTFNGNLGSTQPLGTLTITRADGGVFIGGNSPQPLEINTAGRQITIAAPVTLTGSVVFGQPSLLAGTIDFESTIVSEGTEYNNLTIYAGNVDFHGNVGRLVPDPVGNPDPNLALGTATIEVSGAIHIDPGVEIRVWHENFGIPGGVSQITPVLTLGPTNPPAATPGNPTQTITGSFGLSPNYTEYGQNFTIVVDWDESFRTGISVPPGGHHVCVRCRPSSPSRTSTRAAR